MQPFTYRGSADVGSHGQPVRVIITEQDGQGNATHNCLAINLPASWFQANVPIAEYDEATQTIRIVLDFHGRDELESLTRALQAALDDRAMRLWERTHGRR